MALRVSSAVAMVSDRKGDLLRRSSAPQIRRKGSQNFWLPSFDVHQQKCLRTSNVASIFDGFNILDSRL
jgi:hypothetical protein